MNWDSIACGTTLHHPVKAITFQVRKREPNIQALFDLVCSRFDAAWAPVSLLWEKAAFKPKFLSFNHLTSYRHGFLSYFALANIIFVFLTLAYGIVAIHDIPYNIAKARNHPH
jgi:Protein of unknown function (DUF3302)